MLKLKVHFAATGEGIERTKQPKVAADSLEYWIQSVTKTSGMLVWNLLLARSQPGKAAANNLVLVVVASQYIISDSSCLQYRI